MKVTALLQHCALHHSIVNTLIYVLVECSCHGQRRVFEGQAGNLVNPLVVQHDEYAKGSLPLVV